MGKKFELNKCCDTCEFNFSGICADDGDYGYGGAIVDDAKQRECWNIGLDYYSELSKKGIINRNGKVRKDKEKCDIKEVEEICFYCANSQMDDEEKLYCVIMDGIIVE